MQKKKMLNQIIYVKRIPVYLLIESTRIIEKAEIKILLNPEKNFMLSRVGRINVNR
jgi:hypothetical protein